MVDGGKVVWAAITGVVQGVLFFALGAAILRGLLFLVTGA